MWSRYCNNIEVWHKIEGVNKLVPNLGNKSKYVLHYGNRQLYLSLEMKLVIVHKVLKFKQSNWLKKYIDFNTDKRKNSANSFEKEFFKLMNNSTLGKTMENFRKKMGEKIDYKQCVSKPSFVSQIIFSKNFVAFHEIKPVLKLNKPIYI